MFVNRERELAALEACYATDKAELFVLYGRRRVGKTELLRTFCRDKRHIFFVADLGSEATQLAAFSRVVGRQLLGSGEIGFPSWDAVFDLLARSSQSERLVVVLDEFSYLAQSNPAFPSILQRLWDTQLRESRIMLILCGSYIGLMERDVLAYRAPLYGRRSGQWLLTPLSFDQIGPFLPTYAPADRVRAYAILGGTPAYLTRFDPRRSLGDNILTAILSPQGYLYDEARFLLLQEVREPRSYFAVLEALAQGRTRPNEIAQKAGMGGGAAAMPTLKTLMDLRLVERHVPVTERHPHKSRKGLYRISDPYFRFWFRFVHPQRSALEEGRAQAVLEQQILPVLDHFTSLTFEEICRQHVWRMALPFVPQRVGAWWDRHTEIDVAAVGKAEDALLVGECKWSARPVGANILDDLKRKAARLLGQGTWSQVIYALFSRSGFTPAMKALAEAEAVHLVDLSAFGDSG
ncbi:MAG TPA: ATP-binding protein [Anaerolineae bacterium]|nr:ATP-binding protein [Anaerolineae bacterium]